MWFTEDIDKIFGEKLKKGKDWALCRKKKHSGKRGSADRLHESSRL